MGKLPLSSGPVAAGASSTSTDQVGEYSGYMLKAAPKFVDADKAVSFSRKLRRVANHLLRSLSKNGDFKRRYFVLDGMELRYYRSDDMAHFSGAIDLSTVLEVQYADRAGVPAFAIDLVSSKFARTVQFLFRAFADARGVASAAAARGRRDVHVITTTGQSSKHTRFLCLFKCRLLTQGRLR